MSVGLTNRSVDSTPFFKVTSAFSFDQSAVDWIVGWDELISLINSPSDSSPCSLIQQGCLFGARHNVLFSEHVAHPQNIVFFV